MAKKSPPEGWDHIDPSDPEIPLPKTPDELLAEKKRRESKEETTR